MAADVADAGSVRRTLLRQIAAEQAAHENGAPLGDVVEEVASEYRLTAVCDSLASLHTHGEIYQPADDRLKLTSSPNDPTVFEDGPSDGEDEGDWDPEPAELREGQTRDDDMGHADANDRQVDMLSEDGGEDA